MLALSRKVGEELLIGDNIRVVVLEVRGNSIRLGIAAPKSTTIRRAEISANVNEMEGVLNYKSLQH